MKTHFSLRLGRLLRRHAIPAVACLLISWSASARAQDEATLPADANTTCPVMPEEPSDPGIHVDHEGRRVYLCCLSCKRSFNKDPDKYMKVLSEMEAVAGKADGATTSSAPRINDGTTTAPTGQASVTAPAMDEPAPAAAPPARLTSLERAVRYSGRLHVVSVHFPIGLLLGAAVVEAVAVVRRRPVGSEAARVTLALGTLGALVAVPLGWMNAAFSQNPGMEHYLEWHRWLGTVAGAAALTAWVLARRARSGSHLMEKAYLTALFAGAMLLIVAGHFGAALIYGPDYLKP